MSELTDFRAGDEVLYVPYHAKGNLRHMDCERGRVNSVSDHFVFVRFERSALCSQACKPDQLVKR